VSIRVGEKEGEGDEIEEVGVRMDSVGRCGLGKKLCMK
jgi:hypothetical protein